MSGSVYPIIAGLNKELLSSAVTKKRAALGRLVSHLSDTRFLHRLSVEAGRGSRQQHALSQLWNSIVANTINAVRTILTGRAKATAQDVEPLRTIVLRYVRQRQNFDETDFTAVESVRPQLSTETIQNLLGFCVSFLANDRVLAVAEAPLLELLNVVCGWPEFVRCFKQTDIGDILSELEVRLDIRDEIARHGSRTQRKDTNKKRRKKKKDGDDSDFSDNSDNDTGALVNSHDEDSIDSGGHAVGDHIGESPLPPCDPKTFAAAAKTFESLIRSCREIGVDLHLFLSSSIDLVSGRCRHHLARTDNKASEDPAVLIHLLNAACCLMKSHPDQAIGPLGRDGGAMLRFAKRRYLVTTDARTKDTLIEYFTAHL